MIFQGDIILFYYKGEIKMGNTKIKNCTVCQKEIAKSAKTCPNCGAKIKKPFYKKWWFGLIVIIVLFGSINDGSPSIEESPVSSETEISTETDVQNEVAVPVEPTAPAEPAVPVEPAAPVEPVLSSGQRNALKSAQDYLGYSSFSKSGLKEQLQYEGFSVEDSAYAVETVGADWDEQAYLTAVKYLDYSSFSEQGLIEQLEYEGFTHSQAVSGVSRAY